MALYLTWKSNKKLDMQNKKEGHDLSQHDFPGERTTPFYFVQATQ